MDNLGSVLLSAFCGSVIVLAVSPKATLGALLFVLILLPVGFDLVKGRFDPFALRNLFLAGYFSETLFSAWYSRNIECRYVSRSFFEAHLDAALLYSLLGLSCFYLGYESPLARRATGAPGLAADWLQSRVRVISVALGLASLAAFLVYIWVTGGITHIFQNLYQINDLTLGHTYLIAFTRGCILVAIVLCEVWRAQRPSALLLVWEWLFLIPLDLGSALTFGHRSDFVLLFLSLAAVRTYTSHGRRISWLARSMLVALLCIFLGGYSIFRWAGDSSVSSLWQQTFAASSGADEVSELGRLLFRRFYGIESLELVLDRTGRSVQFAYGGTVAEVFLQAIPRAIWPAKPLNNGDRFTSLYLDDRDVSSGIIESTPSIVGEFYWDFGGVGVVAGMTMLGALLGFCDRYFRENRNASGILLYVPFLFWSLSLAQGDIENPTLAYLLNLLLSASIAYIFVTRRFLGAADGAAEVRRDVNPVNGTAGD